MTNMLSVISGTKRGSTGSVSFDTVESQNARAAAVPVIVEEAATDESHGSVWVSIAKRRATALPIGMADDALAPR